MSHFPRGITSRDRRRGISGSRELVITLQLLLYCCHHRIVGKLKNETAYLDTANGLQCPTFGGDTICQLARGGWSFVEPFSTQKSDRSANFDILPCDRDEKERWISSGSLHVGDTPGSTSNCMLCWHSRNPSLAIFGCYLEAAEGFISGISLWLARVSFLDSKARKMSVGTTERQNSNTPHIELKLMSTL
ncbi:hypothetical protein F5878DRAFT_455156 [Lentinula raphanica]|uniref:Uncharacterized protein n=1 Tax=Lentinula raphanica TaxID=153919 RepID=A0AA38U526_9AGAR|nr:hypothetical protein F5878DRAFT_455156 [Lentinula raphanica]